MNGSHSFDCVVIGAGPAGIMAAYHAAKRGCRVALVERKAIAGVPVRCGEAVGFKGFSASLSIRDSWVLTKIRKIRMISPAGYTVDLVNPAKIGRNYVIDRERMESDLLKEALECGVSYFPSTPIVAIKKGALALYTCVGTHVSFEAPCVVCADGVESRLAKDAGWDTTLAPEDLESCAFCRVTHESIADDTIEFYVGNKQAPGGFVWVFPRGKGVANVGLGVLGSKSAAGKARKLLDTFVAETFPGAQVSNHHCGGVPVGTWLKPLVREGVMVVGDAARQVSSLTGGGIAYALFAGKIAGETIAGAKNANGFNTGYLRKYEKKWAAYCGKQQRRSYALKSALLKKDNDSFYNSVAQALLKEKPEQLNYMRVFMRTFARHPLVLLKTFFLFR